jgi:hypothetical protein
MNAFYLGVAGRVALECRGVPAWPACCADCFPADDGALLTELSGSLQLWEGREPGSVVAIFRGLPFLDHWLSHLPAVEAGYNRELNTVATTNGAACAAAPPTPAAAHAGGGR